MEFIFTSVTYSTQGLELIILTCHLKKSYSLYFTSSHDSSHLGVFDVKFQPGIHCKINLGAFSQFKSYQCITY